MFNRAQLVISSLVLYFSVVLPANAVISLFDSAYNIDGTFHTSTAAAPLNGSLDVNGLGSVSYDFTTAGIHRITAFFDFEIGQTNTFTNEYGRVNGTAAAGQSWEIDEPGFVFGDIYDNLLVGSLDNSNQVPVGSPGDVSFALGWEFTLAAGETGIVTFNLADMLPALLPDFFLEHGDVDSTDTIWGWSTLDIDNDIVSVPEPGTLVLMGIGLFGMGLFRKKRSIVRTH